MGLIIGSIISAALLCLVMWAMARHEAEINFKVVLLICFGVAILNIVLSRLLGYWAILAVFAALAWSLQQFCSLRWSKAILVTLVYIVVSTGLAYLLR
jgi:hypothetical protein